ncbi:P-loop containing nucleoside triphosphate hydrolase protein [Suillus clintonianus]|uniref:P-loop containing nucleoside triphosphate hydrolase protein n=1 Tax=Suillus clintonianus TaxID=1904413 RepID=UPI001B87FFA3|nr:P-loop containing nucleoside triphosphate hydrolase protein [Suillus clintonianus]KAG2143047.1 P-loop containing nucleoside triphosphate hydrolase protein [Suillus clintonianus]
MQPNEPVVPGALAENVPEYPLLEKTEEAGHHYKRRWQIWAPAKAGNPTRQPLANRWSDPEQEWGAPPVQYDWQPYDPSSIQPAAPREDTDNYFYLNVRYYREFFSHFSATLIDFLRMAIGGEFFNSNPDSPLTHFVFKLDELKAHLSDARSAVSNLSGEELKTKAHDLGRLDSLTLQKTEQDARQYLEDLVEHLGVLIPLVESEFEPISKRLELELSYGHISFDLLMYYFKKGEKYYHEFRGDKMAFVLADTSKDSSFGQACFCRYFCSCFETTATLSTLTIEGHGMMWNGIGHVWENRFVDISRYPGTKALSDLQCKIMQDDVYNELTERGKLYAAVSGVHFKSYNGRRVIIDENGYCDRDPESPRGYDDISPYSHRCRVSPPPIYDGAHTPRPGSPNAGDNLQGGQQESLYVLTNACECYAHNDIRGFPEDQLYLLPVKVHGFDVRRKSWETIDVRDLEEIHFDENAWDHLVLNKATKALVKGLVNVTKTTNTSRELFSDVITGKGGGLIALLHGPPGTGKTLTAEAVAEHLKRPLYVLSSLELSTTPATLEKKLGDILKLATTWDAVVLIDEADVFLEQRSLHELERNALVSVALRVLEYHRGVLFLTTNRIQAFDEAFLSRFSIAVKYPELDADARLTIWRKFFELAGCELWGGSGQPGDGRQSPDEFVKLEGQEPQCYVSLADLKELATKPFNGRTIKNLVRTAQALAMSSDEPLSLEHVKVVVEAQEKFLTEFAGIKL